MANLKLVKSATALVLGASVLTSAVVASGTDASAKTTYKVTKKGTLVNAKTNKTVKGYKSYKGKLYKNGKKLTGLYNKRYYKAGVKATGTYKGAYYVKGTKKVTTGTYNGAYYVKGVKKVTTGTYNKAYYVKGKKVVTTGTYKGAYYVKGVKKVTTGVYEDKFYKDGVLNVGLALHKDLYYYNADLANGLIKNEDGVEKLYKDGKVVDLAVESVSAINAKSLEVKFNQAVNDVKEADFSVKKGTVTSNIAKVTIAEDKKSATIELSSKLTAGDYTVSVKNGESTLTGTVTAADEKLDKIEILNEVAPLDDNATPTAASVGVQVFNQYGEDITKTAATGLKVTATGTSVNAATAISPTTSGTVSIPLVSTAKDGDKVVLTIVDPTTGKAASKTITLSTKAAAADVTVGTLYNKDGKKLTQDTETATDLFYLPITVKDQYGNVITKAADVTGSLVIAGVNSSIASVGTLTTIKIDGKDTLVLPVTTGTLAGTTPVNVVVAATGKSSQGSITVEAGKSISNISLGSPINDVVAQSEDIKFPLTVTDNAGNEIKTLKELKALKAGRGLASTTLANVKEIDGALYYVVNAGTDATVTAVAQTDAGKVATQTVVVKAAAKPATIVGLSKATGKTLATSLRSDDTTGLTYAKDNFVFEDQYGRTIASDSDLLKDVTVEAVSADATNSPFDVTTSTIKVKSSLTGITANSDTITFTAFGKKADGTKEVIKGSDFEQKFTVVKASEFASYSVADVDTVSVKKTGTDTYSYQGADYSTDSIVVYGATKSGEKAKLAAKEYSVSGLKGDGSALTLKDADFLDANGKAVTEKTVNAVVTINATGEKITVPVTYSVAPLATEKVTAYDKTTGKVATKLTQTIPAAGTDALTTANLLGALDFKTVDQYGVETALTTPDDVTFTVVSGKPEFAANGTANATVAAAKDGDVVKATVTKDGKSTTIEITFED